jgi:hypothetical protein
MTSALSPDETLRCARHPNTETVLRCGRCETPICPRCQIQTPVGARCPTCARVNKRFATLLKPRELARAIAYGVGAAAAGTAIYTFVPILAILGPLIVFALIGFGVGEVVSVGANRKRVRELAPIAVACLFVGYEIGLVGVLAINGAALEPELFLVPILAARQLQVLVGLLVGALLAWMRTR